MASGLPPTFLLFPPLELQHHVIVAHEGMDWGVQVKDIPQEQAVLPAQLGNHHRHQPVAERLRRERKSRHHSRGDLLSLELPSLEFSPNLNKLDDGRPQPTCGT